MARVERPSAGRECASKKEICVIIPALDEERTIGEVVKGFPQEVFNKSLSVLVVNGTGNERPAWSHQRFDL